LAWQNIPLIWINFKNSHVKLPHDIFGSFLVFAVNGNRDTFLDITIELSIKDLVVFLIDGKYSLLTK
jgi:hypothetical protein